MDVKSRFSKVTVLLATIICFCFFISACNSDSNAENDTGGGKEENAVDSQKTTWDIQYFEFNTKLSRFYPPNEGIAKEIWDEIYLRHLFRSGELSSSFGHKHKMLKAGYTPATSILNEAFIAANPRFTEVNLLSYVLCYETNVMYKNGDGGDIEECGYFVIDSSRDQIALQIYDKEKLQTLSDQLAVNGFIEKADYSDWYK